MAARTWVIGAALALGYAAVLAPPLLLVRHAVEPDWNDETLRVSFDSIHYEAGGLIFRYSVENRTGHTARFLPGETEIRALQRKERPAPGYANIRLPVNLPAHSTKAVELRLELPGNGPTGPSREPTASSQPSFWLTVEDSLLDLDGFELVDPARNLKLVFPRRW